MLTLLEYTHMVSNLFESLGTYLLARAKDGDNEAKQLLVALLDFGNVAAPIVETAKPSPWSGAKFGTLGEKLDKPAKVQPIEDGRAKPRVAYVAIRNRKGVLPEPDFGGFATAKAVWKAISKSRSPIVKPQIMAASGLGKKTVESCIHYLIHSGLIKSQPTE